MTICVFLGPTLPVAEAASILDAVYLPPAAQGDVYQAVANGAEVIGLVDGYFQGVPSVWHKEILWAMSKRTHVFGSASMGALRAAELAVYGMRGIGRVFEAYRDGVLTDDDEVAVVHGPQEVGYRATTVPLVNIRATLSKALEQAVITKKAQAALLDAARALGYWDRTYSALIEQCDACVDQQILDRFSRWIEANAVDQKRDDAIAMLTQMGEARGQPLRVPDAFRRTSAWDNLTAEMHARAQHQTLPSLSEQTAWLLDELRLEPELYRRFLDAHGSADCEGPEVAQTPNRLVRGLIEAGHYAYFADRARDKQRVLSARYGHATEYADAMLRPSEVLGWYFEACGAPVPMDLEGYALDIGLASPGELCRLLLRELLYVLACNDAHPSNGATT